MLDADERQEWAHGAGKLAEMAEILYSALETTLIPRHVAEQMLLTWWAQGLKPNIQFPDFSQFFRQDDEE